MASKLEDILDSHRRFAPDISDKRLLQIIKERRAQLDIPSNFTPEWKSEVLDIYVDESINRRLFVPNPRKKKKVSKKKAPRKKAKKKGTLKSRTRRAGKKVEKAAKAAGKDVEKFAKTKEGYMTAGAVGGALLLGPLGAGLGLLGGKKLHEENPAGFSVSGRVPSTLSPTVYKREANKHAMEAEAYLQKWESEQDPEHLIQALRSTALSGQYYLYAGIPGDARTFGYGPADGQSDAIRAQMMEIMG